MTKGATYVVSTNIYGQFIKQNIFMAPVLKV